MRDDDEDDNGMRPFPSVTIDVPFEADITGRLGPIRARISVPIEFRQTEMRSVGRFETADGHTLVYKGDDRRIPFLPTNKLELTGDLRRWADMRGVSDREDLRNEVVEQILGPLPDHHSISGDRSYETTKLSPEQSLVVCGRPQVEGRVEKLRQHIHDNVALIGTRLYVAAPFPIWRVDLRNERSRGAQLSQRARFGHYHGVANEFDLRSVEKIGKWASSAGHDRFDYDGKVIEFDPAYDRESDLVHMAKSMAMTIDYGLDRHVHDLPASMVRLWKAAIEGLNFSRQETEPRALDVLRAAKTLADQSETPGLNDVVRRFLREDLQIFRTRMAIDNIGPADSVDAPGATQTPH